MVFKALFQIFFIYFHNTLTVSMIFFYIYGVSVEITIVLFVQCSFYIHNGFYGVPLYANCSKSADF